MKARCRTNGSSNMEHASWFSSRFWLADMVSWNVAEAVSVATDFLCLTLEFPVQEIL